MLCKKSLKKQQRKNANNVCKKTFIKRQDKIKRHLRAKTLKCLFFISKIPARLPNNAVDWVSIKNRIGQF